MKMVLLADDSDDIRRLLRALLEMRGCRVVEASDGRQAVELAARVSPGLILMDLSMPELDGFEATRQIRSRAELQNVPVVAVSAFCDVDNRQKAFAAGCVECISKPIDFGVIAEVVGRYLPTG